MRDMEKEHAAGHEDRIKGWKADCERAKVEWGSFQGLVKEAQKGRLPTPRLPDDAVEPAQPQRRRLLVQDSTPESLAVILSGNPTGTLHLRDELAGWLTSFDRYTPGGREFWLEAYGGRPFVIDRKGSPEPVTVPFNGVSVVGGIQPEKLAEALLGKGKPDDGLVARFLWAWPDRVPYQRPRRTADHSLLATMYSRFDGLAWGVGPDGQDLAVTLTLDDAAADVFEAFERANREAGDEAAGLYKSFLGKLNGMVLRLALVSEYARWAFEGGPEPRSIRAKTLAAVAEFVDEYAKPTAMRVFGDAALPLVERNAATLARLILKHKLKRVNARELKRTPYKQLLAGMREAEPLNEALAYLVDADWLKPIGSRAGPMPGRQSSDFAVNPGLHGGSNG
jgi:putative DNA primase/helicase